jgi:uncharacterized membrane protein YbhN (UPF0104 family)
MRQVTAKPGDQEPRHDDAVRLSAVVTLDTTQLTLDTSQVVTDATEIEQHAVKASHNLRLGLISLAALIAIAVGLLLAVPGLHGVAHEITSMPPGWVALAVALEAMSCVGYVIAFLQVFERAPIRFGARVALSELAFGAAVPIGGAGSVAVGALLLVERGAPPGHIAKRSAVLFLLTSAINVITLAVVGIGTWIGVLPGSSDPLLTLLPGAIGVIVFFGFLALPHALDRFAKDRNDTRLLRLAHGTSDSIRETAQILFRLDWRIVGAYAFLWCDIAVLWCCFAAVGPVPPVSTVVLAYQIGYLSNLIPIPGGIGVLDGSFVAMFALYGVSATHATSSTLVYHAISLWVPALWGTVTFVLLRRTRNQPLVLRPTLDERRAARRAGR